MGYLSKGVKGRSPFPKYFPLSLEGVNTEGESKRGEASLTQLIPPPCIKGGG